MISEDTKDLIAGIFSMARSSVLLALPWTRRAAMDREITLAAEYHKVTRMQAFALMYDQASPAERLRLAPYRPALSAVPDEDDEVSWEDPG